MIIMDMETRLFGITPSDVKHLVFKYCKKNGIKTPFNKETEAAGDDWLRGFLSRNKDVSVRTPEAVSMQRAVGFNRSKVDPFYKNLKKILFSKEEDRLIPVDNISNVDESGFTICQKPQKILAKRGKKAGF